MERAQDIIIGAGFYGSFLALQLAKQGRTVIILETGADMMERASAINQARVHTGFHYPRSFTTALSSLRHYTRFIEEFAPAIIDDFEMIYAVARHKSKITAARFLTMYQAMGAPIGPAPSEVQKLFNPGLIESAFLCREHAFDYRILRDLLKERLAGLPAAFHFHTQASRITREGSLLAVIAADGRIFQGERIFNVTYAGLNHLLVASGAAPLPIKYEWTELALMEPPSALARYGVTVMDGPFFSLMPYPARKLYSFSHVRYTPHSSWTDNSPHTPSAAATARPCRSYGRYMLYDAARYMPCLRDAQQVDALFEIKAVPLKNESDDGRPIYLRTHTELPGVYSVLGSKLDNIYDLLLSLGLKEA